MTLMSASLKLGISVATLLFGLYLLFEGSFVDVRNGFILLIAGAVCVAISFKIALDSLQRIVWHIFLARHAFRIERRRS